MKLRYLQTEITRFGRTVHYFRRGKGHPRIRLPDDRSSPDFHDCYLAALEGREFQLPKPLEAVEKEKFTRSVEIAAKTAVYRAKSRAAKKGREFALSYQWAMETIRNQGHRCALTGIHFDHKFSTAGTMKPYSPSVDRIDNSKGYTPENCRMIVSAMNIMLSDWGTEIFHEVARGYARSAKLKKNEKPRT